MSKNWYWLAAFIVVGVLLGAGIIYLVTRPPRGEAITLLPAPTIPPLTVYVSGKVNQAGLYALPVGARLNDAIQAAGGFAADADTSGFNLARVLVDGEQVDVPAMVTPAPILPAATAQISPIITSPPIATSGPVNINTATLEQLDMLPGIGFTTAQKIIDYRVANGPFVTIEAIMDVPGIGQVKFDAMKDLITVGTSP